MDTDTLFDALADRSRRHILLLLLERGEQCVCNIHGRLHMSQPKASRHLAVLRQSGLLMARREGKWIHYRINPDLPPWCQHVLDGMREGAPALDLADESQSCPMP